MRGRFTILLPVLLIGAVAPLAPAQSLQNLFGRGKPIDPARRIIAKIKMRDGAELSTLVILPEGKGPWPAIVTRTPYGKESAGLAGVPVNFAEKGFAQVTQDTRGTGESEGVFGQFQYEKGDGYDTLDWVAKQPWCNGKIGMFGVSASGILANFAAMTSPPNLVCTFVVVAHGCDFRFGSYSGGVFLKDLNERWFRTLGHPLPETLRPRLAVYDDVAAGMDMKNHYADVKVPTFNVCGWYDCFAESGIENFEGLQQHGSGNAKGNQKLIVGAFGHFPLNGKIEYPREASKPDTSAVERWFNHWLKDDDNGIERDPSARYYVMGDPFDKEAPGNEWRVTSEWPPTSTPTRYWLAPKGELRTSAPDLETALSYDSDPRNPVPTIGGNNLFLPRGPMDQSRNRDRKDVLRFVSAPLADPVEVVGRVTARLSVSTDAEDTDFMVKLVDIYPDGYEALVLDQALRLRFRDGFEHSQKAEPDGVYPISINLGTTALVFNKGHRIAVHVQSTNSPRFEPHSNTWEPVSDVKEMKVAHNTVHLGGEAGSCVILPVTMVHRSQTKVASSNE